MTNKQFINNVKNRSFARFIIGIVPRFYNYYLNEFVRMFAISRGASIGCKSSIPFKLALKANKNLIIGYNSIIESSKVDLREKITFGDNIIVNKGVEIIRQSHNFNSERFETIGNKLIIGNYVWITTKVLILPNCTRIDEGAIIAAGSTLTKNVMTKEIFGGVPAVCIGYRERLPVELDNSALQGRNFKEYIKARYEK